MFEGLALDDEEDPLPLDEPPDDPPGFVANEELLMPLEPEEPPDEPPLELEPPDEPEEPAGLAAPLPTELDEPPTGGGLLPLLLEEFEATF